MGFSTKKTPAKEQTAKDLHALSISNFDWRPSLHRKLELKSSCQTLANAGIYACHMQITIWSCMHSIWKCVPWTIVCSNMQSETARVLSSDIEDDLRCKLWNQPKGSAYQQTFRLSCRWLWEDWKRYCWALGDHGGCCCFMFMPERMIHTNGWHDHQRN